MPDETQRTYNVYPNVRTPQRGAERIRRGCLRTGMIVEDDDTLQMGISGLPAAVTQEADGYARVYVLIVAVDEPPLWYGPHRVFSEEVDT